jgi:hypothetical protein
MLPWKTKGAIEQIIPSCDVRVPQCLLNHAGPVVNLFSKFKKCGSLFTMTTQKMRLSRLHRLVTND